MKDCFKVIILVGRPASGKSEVIDYLKKVPCAERVKRFHLGEFEEIDDFPFVWQVFEDDDIFQKHHKPRIHTTEDYYFKDPFIWNFFIEKINLRFAKKIAGDSLWLDKKTAIVEFSRGGADGYREAFSYLSDEILQNGCIVYINVSYEESLRKNRRRARPELKDSILYHSLPDEKMEFYYKIDDWKKISENAKEGFLPIRDFRLPYAVFDNEPEVTDKPDLLGRTLEEVFGKLWHLAKKR